jgi:hypothetical protein
MRTEIAVVDSAHWNISLESGEICGGAQCLAAWQGENNTSDTFFPILHRARLHRRLWPHRNECLRESREHEINCYTTCNTVSSSRLPPVRSSVVSLHDNHPHRGRFEMFSPSKDDGEHHHLNSSIRDLDFSD